MSSLHFSVVGQSVTPTNPGPADRGAGRLQIASGASAACPVNDNLRFPTPISITLPLTSRVYPN